MRIEFEFLSGARAGRKAAFEKSYIALGRDPLADVRFDAEADLDASTKHAAVIVSGDVSILCAAMISGSRKVWNARAILDLQL